MQTMWNEKWRLAKLDQNDLIRVGLIALMIAIGFVMFHYQGNTTDVRAFGRSALLWMISWWKDDPSQGTDYSHGWLIPIVSIAVVWLKKSELAAAPKNVSYVGLSLVVLALLMHWVGAKAQQTRITLLALVLLLWAIPFYINGWKVAKILIFPCTYLLVCVPLNFFDSLTFPLQMFATVVSAAMLNGFGLAVARHGSMISMMAEGGFRFEVGEACSGIRSLVAMMALTAAYAYLTQDKTWKKWVLFLSSIPLAIVGNIARITTVGLVAEAFGEKLALGLYHDYSGYVIFSVAILLMLAIGRALESDFGQWRERWKYALLNPTSP